MVTRGRGRFAPLPLVLDQAPLTYNADTETISLDYYFDIIYKCWEIHFSFGFILIDVDKAPVNCTVDTKPF